MRLKNTYYFFPKAIAAETCNKIIEIGTFTTDEGWRRKEHGITNSSGSAGFPPTSVALVLECINATGVHGYAVGDRIYNLSDTETNTSGMWAHADATYVTAIIPGDGGTWELPKKYGANTPDSSTHSGSGYANFEWVTQKPYFKVLAIVNQ